MELLSIIQKRILGGDIREFRDDVRKAVKDGKLTEREIRELETKREELKLPQDILDAVRIDLYLSALQTVSEDETVTDEEWQEMEHIQDYLGVEDREVLKSKKELYRRRIMSEIRNGNMPLADAKNVLLGAGETAYWVEPVTLLEPVTKKGTGFRGVAVQLPIGIRFSVREKYEQGGKGWKKVAEGDLILTNERLLFQSGPHSFVFPWPRVAAAEFSVGGLMIQGARGEPKYLRYKTKGNHNIVGSIVSFAHTLAKKRS